jgi:hypothetical protein
MRVGGAPLYRALNDSIGPRPIGWTCEWSGGECGECGGVGEYKVGDWSKEKRERERERDECQISEFYTNPNRWWANRDHRYQP